MLLSHPVMTDSLWPHGPQHTRPLCPSPSPGACPGSCSLHRWCHPAVWSSDALFSFCPQSFPAPGTVSHLFTSVDQNTGSASVLPVRFQGWSPLRLTGLISLLYKPRWVTIQVAIKGPKGTSRISTHSRFSKEFFYHCENIWLATIWCRRKRINRKGISSPHCVVGRLLHGAGWGLCIYSQSFVIIMEKKNIICKIRGCSLQKWSMKRICAVM